MHALATHARTHHGAPEARGGAPHGCHLPLAEACTRRGGSIRWPASTPHPPPPAWRAPAAKERGSAAGLACMAALLWGYVIQRDIRITLHLHRQTHVQFMRGVEGYIFCAALGACVGADEQQGLQAAPLRALAGAQF